MRLARRVDKRGSVFHGPKGARLNRHDMWRLHEAGLARIEQDNAQPYLGMRVIDGVEYEIFYVKAKSQDELDALVAAARLRKPDGDNGSSLRLVDIQQAVQVLKAYSIPPAPDGTYSAALSEATLAALGIEAAPSGADDARLDAKKGKR